MGQNDFIHEIHINCVIWISWLNWYVNCTMVFCIPSVQGSRFFAEMKMYASVITPAHSSSALASKSLTNQLICDHCGFHTISNGATPDFGSVPQTIILECSAIFLCIHLHTDPGACAKEKLIISTVTITKNLHIFLCYLFFFFFAEAVQTWISCEEANQCGKYDSYHQLCKSTLCCVSTGNRSF